MTNSQEQTQEQLIIDLFTKHHPSDVLDVLHDASVSHGMRLDVEALDLLVDPDPKAEQYLQYQKEVMQDLIRLFALLTEVQTVNA